MSYLAARQGSYSTQLLHSTHSIGLDNCGEGSSDRVFDINPGDDTNPANKFTVTLQGFTITGGIAQTGDAAAGSGGAIRAQGIASLTLTNMLITNNMAIGVWRALCSSAGGDTIEDL